jgi:hypothetical protein
MNTYSEVRDQRFESTEFRSAINNSLIPGHRLCFDLFPVAEPADVRPTCGDWVELKL